MPSPDVGRPQVHDAEWLKPIGVHVTAAMRKRLFIAGSTPTASDAKRSPMKRSYADRPRLPKYARHACANGQCESLV